MFIQTEDTPNPATLKFLPGRAVTGNGIVDCPTLDKAAQSPLAKRLFDLAGVAGVMLGPDFIAVSKAADTSWAGLKPQLLAEIMEHFLAGDPVLAPQDGDSKPDAAAADPGHEADAAVIARIVDLLDTRVRPVVTQDGGDIVFQGFRDGVVYLHMRGACSGCPSATATLKSGIENLLRHFVPEVTEVRQVRGE